MTTRALPREPYACPSPRARLATRRRLSGREPHGSHAPRAPLAAIPSMFLSYPCCNRLQVNPRPPLVAAAGTAVAAAAAAPATAGAAIATIIADTIAAAAAVSAAIAAATAITAAIAAASAVSASVAHTAIANARLRYHHLRYPGHWTAVAAAAAIATPTTTAAAIAIDSIASAADSTAAAAITAAIAATSAVCVSALVAHAAIAMLSAATITTTSRSAGSAAQQQPPFHHVGAPSTQPQLQRTFGHLYRTSTDQISPTDRTARTDPTFSRLPRRLQLRSSRSRTSLWCGVQRAGARSTVVGFRCAAARPACLPPCHRMAACRNAQAPPLPPPESQVARRHAI